MKLGTLSLALSLSLLGPVAALAAPVEYVCSVTAVSDPANRPNVFDKELINVSLTKDSETHYTLLKKDLSGAEEISREAYEARKNEKRFQDIDGQEMAIFQREEGDLLYVTFGTLSAAEGKLVNGGSAMGYAGQDVLANFPLHRRWAAGCRAKK